jgi:MarR family transcriptional regulator, multiple antibiotic resistance protein MarR
MADYYDPETTEPHDTLAPLVKRVMLAMFAAVDEAFQQDRELAVFEVTAAQFGILANLHYGEAECAGELCKNMNYDRGAMSRMLDRLEDKGLIRRVRHSGERRMISLEITPRGEKLLPKMKTCVVATLNRFLRGIPEADVRRAEDVLRKMLDNGA